MIKKRRSCELHIRFILFGLVLVSMSERTIHRVRVYHSRRQSVPFNMLENTIQSVIFARKPCHRTNTTKTLVRRFISFMTTFRSIWQPKEYWFLSYFVTRLSFMCMESASHGALYILQVDYIQCFHMSASLVPSRTFDALSV